MKKHVSNQRLLTAVLAVLLSLVLLGVPALASADETDDPVNMSRLKRVSELMKKRQPVQARAVARLLVADNPNWVDAWLALGTTYTTREEDFELAEEAFLRAKKLDDGSSAVYRNLAALEQRRKNFDEAADYILKAAELNEDDIDLQVLAGQTLFRANRIAEAKSRFKVVLESDPTNVMAVTGYGALLSDRGEYSAAIEAYRKALDAGQDHPLIYYNLGNSLIGAARYEEALETVREGYKNRKDETLKILEGDALVQLGRYEEAEEVLTELLGKMTEGNDQTMRPTYTLAIGYSMQGCALEKLEQCGGGNGPECCEKNRKALELYEKLHGKNQDYRDVVIRLGLAQFAAGQLEDAEATLQNYVNEKGDKVEAEAFGALSVVLYAWGEERDIEEAIRLYREARELAPDFDSGDRLEKFRDWPPYAVQSIKEIRDLADEEDAKAAQKADEGCSCTAVRVPTSPTPTLILAMLVGIVFWQMRRRRHA